MFRNRSQTAPPLAHDLLYFQKSNLCDLHSGRCPVLCFVLVFSHNRDVKKSLFPMLRAHKPLHFFTSPLASDLFSLWIATGDVFSSLCPIRMHRWHSSVVLDVILWILIVASPIVMSHIYCGVTNALLFWLKQSNKVVITANPPVRSTGSLFRVMVKQDF